MVEWKSRMNVRVGVRVSVAVENRQRERLKNLIYLFILKAASTTEKLETDTTATIKPETKEWLLFLRYSKSKITC